MVDKHGTSPPPGPDRLDHLAGAFARARDEVKRLRVAHERAQEVALEARADLMLGLEAAGEGAVAVAFGVAYYLRTAPDGRAVDRAAIDRHEDSLGPLGLAARTTTVTTYPTLAELERHRAEIRKAGLEVAELIETGPDILKLRTRTLSAET